MTICIVSHSKGHETTKNRVLGENFPAGMRVSKAEDKVKVDMIW